ncbi:hypothetical protein [Mucilaginibacter sp. PAMB04168]|uniref:hypothetical protein n=1 Tax=Mucilaginibacter sp. PAMB04168 TaxID=3138567 RepID=UPI0031F64282
MVLPRKAIDDQPQQQYPYRKKELFTAPALEPIPFLNVSVAFFHHDQPYQEDLGLFLRIVSCPGQAKNTNCGF